MLYFKHAELVKKYHVSLKTIHNWIDAAKQGKLDLNLHHLGTRTYIANNAANNAQLKQLADHGKKYRNTRFHKTISPKPEFYKIYSPRQILDIISNLNVHREIPLKYNYLDSGAQNWDSWAKHLKEEDTVNPLNSTIDLLHANLGAIELLVKGRKRINVIDIGVGNAYPVQELLEHLYNKNILHRYIAVDISQRMLDIAKDNITKWFGNKINFEGYVRDISFERFDDLLIDDMLGKEAEGTINLILLLGGTPVNFPSFSDPLHVIYPSMGDKDLIIYTTKPDTENSRRYFDFNAQPRAGTPSNITTYTLNLLGLDESFYETEMGFSEQKRMRYIKIRLKTSVTIKFKFNDTVRNVYFEKGESILIYRAWHLTAVEIISQFENSGFVLLQSGMTRDRDYLLTISGVDAKLAA